MKKSEKKQNCSLHIISHQNSASSALVKEKMIFLTSAVRLNAVKLFGVSYEKFLLPEDASEEMVLNTIAQVNEADDIHGVLLFRPLPRHLDENKIINALAVEKDIDGITDRSMASVFLGKQTGFAPCTPSACMKILDHYGIDCSGKSCRDRQKSRRWKTSRHDASPEKRNCHDLSHKTKDMPSVVKEADIVIVAAGRAGVIGADYLRAGQTVIDVGINVNEEGKLCGDVNFADAEPVVDAITPVPAVSEVSQPPYWLSTLWMPLS